MSNKYLSSEEISDLKIKREKLINAYVSGVASISHNGKTTTFRSMADLRAAIDLINSELGIKRTRIIKTVTNRGL